MSWLLSFLIAVTTAVAGGLAAGFVANLAVGWHRIPSMEGQSGYFVVMMFLAGVFGGFVLGLIASRVAAARPNPSFLRSFFIAHATVLGLIGVIGASSRVLADVPPEIRGETLLLAVEVGFPPGRVPPAVSPGSRAEIVLGTLSRTGRVRRSERGPLWLEDSALAGDRWVVPGAVEVFTSRGRRLLEILPGGDERISFIVPLPRYPDQGELSWSEWIPIDAERENSNGFRYRFRVVPRNQPIRTETHGPFEIDTIAHAFYDVSEGETLRQAVDAEFVIRHRGRPVTIGEREVKAAGTPEDRFTAVAALTRSPNLLLVERGRHGGDGECTLLVSQGETLRSVPLPGCGRLRSAELLRFENHGAGNDPVRLPPGRFDRMMFADDGLVLMGESVLDTRELSVHAFRPIAEKSSRIAELRPLLLSPDHRTFVLAGHDLENYESLLLEAFDLQTGDSYAVPVDEKKTRYGGIESLTPAWANHYFEWNRGADGIDRLQAREEVVPLPYHGKLTSDYTGYREYAIPLAGDRVMEALIQFIRTEFGATPFSSGSYATELRVGEQTIYLSRADSAPLRVWTDRGTDSEIIARIASRFDEELASGRYDALFD